MVFHLPHFLNFPRSPDFLKGSVCGLYLFPAFVITYTPSCQVPESNVDCHVTFCRGDTAQLSAAGYDHYEWTPGIGLSDSTTANPLCFADSSR